MFGVGPGVGFFVNYSHNALPVQSSSVNSTPVPAGTEYASVSELREQMAQPGGLTSEGLVNYLQERIRKLDPQLKSVIELNPEALETARSLDRERANGKVRGPLHGIPILLKDTIETTGMQTSAGAFGLVGEAAGKNAPLVEHLISQGAVILGKSTCRNCPVFATPVMAGAAGVGKPGTLIIRTQMWVAPVPARQQPSLQGWRPWRWGPKPTARSSCLLRSMGWSGSSQASVYWTVTGSSLPASAKTPRGRWRGRYSTRR